MPDVRIRRWETLTKTQFDCIDRERAVVLVTCSPLEGEGPAERAVDRLLDAPKLGGGT